MDLFKLKNNKLLLIVLFCTILLVGPISAFEFDNVKDYDSKTNVITIRNSFLGIPTSLIAEVTLESDSIEYVNPGNKVKVAEFTIDNKDDYNGLVLNDVKFYNFKYNRWGKQIQKAFDYKVGTVQSVSVYDYETICSTRKLGNGTNQDYNCVQSISGNHLEDKLVWDKLGSNSNLIRGEYKIGIFTDVLPGEKVEWIPTLYGVEITEWASFVGSRLLVNQSDGDDGDVNVFTPGSWAIQTFTIGRDYLVESGIDEFYLDGVSVMVWDSGAGIDFELFIVATNSSEGPNSTIIARNTTTAIAQVPAVSPGSFINITFPGTILQNGTTYGLLMNSSNAGGGNQIRWRSNSIGTSNGTAWLGQDNVWGKSGVTKDMMFKIWGRSVAITKSELISPADASSTIETSINFTANYTTGLGLNLKNATYRVWRDDGTLFNSTFTLINESTNSTTVQINDFTLDSYIWNVLACAENVTNVLCGYADANFTFNVAVNFTDLDYNNETTEGSTETFKINATIPSGLTLTETNFIYNNTNFGGSFTVVGTNKLQVLQTITTPPISADVNKSFFFNLILSDGRSSNSTETNQTVRALSIDDCSVSSTLILNLTLRDEENQTMLGGVLFNTTIEYSINIYPLGQTTNSILNISNQTNEINPTSICINNDLVNISYRLDSTIKYESFERAVEYYNIQNFTLTNTTIPQHIDLYDLLTTDSTEFKLTFTGTDFLPAEDVLVFVERQYLSENNFKTVELPKTDTNGQTILHLVINDIVYNLIFIKEGEVLKNFRNLRAFCDPAIELCTISLNALSEEDNIITYDQELGIAFPSPPTYNSSTNLVSFSYTSIDGSAKNISMSVERKDIFGNTSVCSNSLNSISGIIACNIGSGITDTTLETTISVDGNKKIISQVVIDDSAFGSFGYVAWFLLALGLVLSFSKDKNGILIALLISYIGAVGLGLIVGGIIGVGSAGIWIIIITLIGLWRLNKNKID